MGSSERRSHLESAPWPLPAGEVHVWRVVLEAPVSGLPYDRLSESERGRVARIRGEESQIRFVLSHAAQRSILAGYLGIEAHAARLTANSYGKPALEDCVLHFNLSHADGLALVAVTRAGEVGVDVERVRPNVGGESIARRFFSPRELEAFLAAGETDREQAFFRCWTRKEAFVKAVGEGLSFPLADFDVSLEPGGCRVLLAVHGDSTAANCWTLTSVPVPTGYEAAVAVHAPSVRVVCRDWNENE